MLAWVGRSLPEHLEREKTRMGTHDTAFSGHSHFEGVVGELLEEHGAKVETLEAGTSPGMSSDSRRPMKVPSSLVGFCVA